MRATPPRPIRRTPLAGAASIVAIAFTLVLPRAPAVDADGAVRGRGATLYDGEVELVVERTDDGRFRLRDPERRIVTLDARNGTDAAQSVDITSATPAFETERAAAAVSVHWAAVRLLDYWRERFGRRGWDGRGGELRQHVHWGKNHFNATFDRGQVVYGDGGAHESTAIVSLDYVGHEVSHGITLTAGVGYEGEIAALNESYSDILAKCFERWAKPDRSSWLVFPEIYRTPGRATRSMSDPKRSWLSAQPDTYRGELWRDDGGPHENGGPQNRWFHLLVEGGHGANDLGDRFRVDGIGWARAEQLVWRAVTVYMRGRTSYADARLAADQAAADLFGASGRERRSVLAAWDAVGVTDAIVRETRAKRPEPRKVENATVVERVRALRRRRRY